MASPVFAGSFKAVPIKLFLGGRAETAVLKVTNNGAEKVTIQLEAKEWSQDQNGKDAYTDTMDIIFFPKIVDIEKGEERIIRVGYKGDKSGSKEGTYRLFIQELPIAKPGEMALKFALNLSIPVFIKPLEVVKEISIQEVNLSEGRVLVKVRNSGNAHFIVSRIRAIGLGDSEAEVFSKDIDGWYILSGKIKTYAIDISEDECRKANQIKVSVQVEGESMDAKLDVNAARCEGHGEPNEGEKEVPETKGSH